MAISVKAVPRRGGKNKVIGKSGKSLLVIVEGNDINKMLDAGLEAIGGLKLILTGNKKVVLKPNTNQRDPFPSVTDPQTIRTVARHCRTAGANKIIVHEDHKEELDFYYNHEELPGIDIEISHAPNPQHYVLVEYEKWQNELFCDTDLKGSTYRGPALKLNDVYQKTEGPRLRVARQLQEAPVIINMPVLKRHMAAFITSALKNHFGSVYGAHRWIAHAAYAQNSDYYSRRLAEFASAIRPELTITDVRSLQAVSGPFRMESTRIVNGVNRLIITGDMVAADTVALDIMKKWDATFTPKHEAFVRSQLKHAENLGVGSSDLSKFEVIQLKV